MKKVILGIVSALVISSCTSSMPWEKYKNHKEPPPPKPKKGVLTFVVNKQDPQTVSFESKTELTFFKQSGMMCEAAFSENRTLVVACGSENVVSSVGVSCVLNEGQFTMYFDNSKVSIIVQLSCVE